MQLSNSTAGLHCELQSSQDLKGLRVSLFVKRKWIEKCLTGFQENLKVIVSAIIKNVQAVRIRKNADLHLWDRKKLYTEEKLQQNQKKSSIFFVFLYTSRDCFFLEPKPSQMSLH